MVMCMKRFILWTAAIAVAGIAAACDGSGNSPGLSPTAASENGNSSSSAAVLSPTQQQAAAACGVNPGNTTIGNPPADGTPTTQPGVPGQGPVTIGPGGGGGAPQVVFTGEVTVASGQYPSMTLTIGPQIVRTTAATSFHNVSGSIATGTRLGAVGTIQPDQSIAATCVTGL
jgi:hypothetical protein